jgi:hypothetical protein
MLLYHVLWELTHVVLEHPGLLELAPARVEASCAPCADEALVAEVVLLHDADRADVVSCGDRRTVDVTLVEGVTEGDLVLVHAGVALTVLRDGHA